MEKKYNLKSPAVKRLMREAAELKDPTDQYHAQPLEDNLFEWHFTVRGPPDTEFSEGRYHGRITLPTEYPMKPPSIILLTPNGRFELGKKICLSMSAHHPETWQPSWSLRTVLLALIGFMPSKGAGAIGSLDYSPDERRNLAQKSRDWTCNACGIDHGTCLLEADPENEDNQKYEAKELAAQISFKAEPVKAKANEESTVVSSNPSISSASSPVQPINENQLLKNQNQNDDTELQRNSVENVQHSSYGSSPDMVVRQRPTVPSVEQVSSQNETNVTSSGVEQTSSNNRANSSADYISLILLWIVAIILVVLIIRRLAVEGNSLPKTNY